MKAISIQQPFASLIAAGLKKYEFRTWPTAYRGEILIHAGKTVNRKAMKKFEKYGLEYPVGCIIAKAKITDCVKVTDEMVAELVKEEPVVYSGFAEEPEWEGYGFKLEEVSEIEPIEANGMLGLWEFEIVVE